MADPTNAQLEAQIKKVSEIAQVAVATSKAALTTAKKGLAASETAVSDVAAIKEWLKPLSNGVGERVSKLDILVRYAEAGQEAERRRDTLVRAGDIIFGWIPSNIRKGFAVIAGLSVVAGALSSFVIIAGWFIETLHHFHLHPLGL